MRKNERKKERKKGRKKERKKERKNKRWRPIKRKRNEKERKIQLQKVDCHIISNIESKWGSHVIKVIFN